jgi:hypothetical protein
MNFTVTAFVPELLVTDITVALSSILGDRFVVGISDNLTKANYGLDAVLCFSGQFTSYELDQLASLGFDLPGVHYWVQDQFSNEVLMSNAQSDIGKTEFAISLLSGSGVVFTQAVTEVTP